jgi:hypothetical protein
VAPSILAFDINESMLDINHMQPLFKRLFGNGDYVNACKCRHRRIF